MSTELFVHPQETWTEAECAKRAKRVNRDGLGTPGGPRGLINADSSPYPSYGQTRRYNGGCLRNGQYYKGETVPLPQIPPTYRFRHVSSWGTVIELNT